jgi:hypothetical protein
MPCESPLLRASELRLEAYALEVEAWKADHWQVMRCYRIEDLLMEANTNYEQLGRLYSAWENDARSGHNNLTAEDWTCLDRNLREWRNSAREALELFLHQAPACDACGFERDPARYLQVNLEDCERLIGELQAARITPSKGQLARAASESKIPAAWYTEEW